MRYITLIVTIFCMLTININANERKVLFEGLGAKIIAITDSMDKEIIKSAIFNFDKISIAVFGSNDFSVWPNSENLKFATNAENLFRVGNNKPFTMMPTGSGHHLKIQNSEEARIVLKSLANRDEVRIRYYDFPEYNITEAILQNPNFGYIYHKAAKAFGWDDIGGQHDISPAKIDIYIPEEPKHKGSALVHVEDNRKLGLFKIFDQYGGGGMIKVGIKNTFGFQEKKWICGEVDLSGNSHLIIRDEFGKILFKEIVPSDYSSKLSGESWPVGKKAAKKAWEAAPLGTIEVEGEYGETVLLYGFRELWQWGVENAGFPLIK